MAWTKPIDWIDGKRYVAADLNKVRDNFNALRTGGIAIPGQTAGDLIVAVSADQLGRMPASEVDTTQAELAAKVTALAARIAALEAKVP